MRELFSERMPLYGQYADLTVESSSYSAELVTTLILRKLGALPKPAPKKKEKTQKKTREKALTPPYSCDVLVVIYK